MSKVVAPKFFLQVPVSIASMKGLTSLDKLVYSEIYTMINVTNKFYMSNNVLGERLGKNRRSIIRSINHLKNKNLINVTINEKNGNKMRSITLGSDKLSLGVVTSCHRGSDKMSPGVVTTCHPNRSVNRPVNRSSDKSTSKSDREIPKFSKVCRYYDQELMINRLTASQTRWLFRDAKDWSKQFPLVTIKHAIDTAHKVDLKHKLHNPVPYINRILANDKYREKNKSNKHDSKPDYYSHKQFLKDDLKQQREATIYMKKVGLI